MSLLRLFRRLPLRQLHHARAASLEVHHDNAAVRFEASAGCGFCRSERIGREDISRARQHTSIREALLQEVALLVNIGIDVVGYSAIALVLLKAIVMGGGAHPQRLPPYRLGGFPYAEVVTDRGYLQRRGAGKRQVLRSAEEIQR